MRLKNQIRAGRLLYVCLAIAAATFFTANHHARGVTADLNPQDQVTRVGVQLLPAATQKEKSAKAANEIQLAIMSTPDFDATQVDPATVVFAGALVVANPAGQYKVRLQDVDGDGLADLVVTLNRSALQVGAQAIKAHFSAQTRAGGALVGIECLQPSGEPCFTGVGRANAQTLSPGTPSPASPAANFSENFDSVTAPALPTGWTTSFVNGANCFSGSNWVTSTADPASAPNSACHNDPACVTDNYLISPAISITSTSPTLSFSNAYSLEAGTTSGFDGGVLEVSTDGGSTWADVTSGSIGGSFVTGGYNRPVPPQFLNPLGGRMAWSGLSGGSDPMTPAYITTTVNLGPNLAGKTIKLRWRLGTDNTNDPSSTVLGCCWYIDNVVLTDQAACTLTCPANVTQSNDQNQCGAVVNYPAPTTTGTCGAVTCSPASGSFFPVGTTTVSCSDSSSPGCSFTVTINDTQPPAITCPANMSVSGTTCQSVNYTTPTPSDNCPGATASCSPASGTCFPVGTTTVTCTATDAHSNTAQCFFTVTVGGSSCTLTCPANITRSNDPNQCGAVTTYPAPTTTGTCGTVTCSPASGSFFPKGTTTVSCSTTAGPNCSFTVTVNDTQRPSITCPANQTTYAGGAQACLPGTATTVNYPSPTASDNCPGVTTNCTPPSGSTFPVGTTTVTCTATDASGNTASCSFTVTVFSSCLQDDANPGTVVVFNAATGEYRFCCNGTAFTGIGKVTVRGCVVQIEQNATDRRVLIKADFAARTGTASLQVPPGVTRCTISDRNTSNNTCACGSSPPTQ